MRLHITTASLDGPGKVSRRHNERPLEAREREAIFTQERAPSAVCISRTFVYRFEIAAGDLIRWANMQRRGSWQTSRARPVTRRIAKGGLRIAIAPAERYLIPSIVETCSVLVGRGSCLALAVASTDGLVRDVITSQTALKFDRDTRGRYIE